jgi:hypothetical protein
LPNDSRHWAEAEAPPAILLRPRRRGDGWAMLKAVRRCRSACRRARVVSPRGWLRLQSLYVVADVVQVFLDNLDDAVASLTLARLAAIGTTYNLTSPSQNDEIKFRWYDRKRAETSESRASF